jgi:hypothetical protein
MRLIHKSTFERDVAQSLIGAKHVFGRQFDAAPDHESMGGVPERASKHARKVRLAARHQCAQIRHRDATGDVPVDVGEYLSSLPCQQTLFAIVPGLFGSLRINLPSQKRGCLEYRSMRSLSLVKVTDGCIQQRNYNVHPAIGSMLSDLWVTFRFADSSMHCCRPPIENAISA